jgi:hypothetical protein
MFSRRLFIYTLMVITVATVGCQQKKSRTDRQRIGRTLRGPVAYSQSGTPMPLNSSNPGVAWGEATDFNQQSFKQSLDSFAAPSLDGRPQDESLGFVSSQSRQQTGVRFWGEVRSTQNGIDPSRSRIHIEVYDDRYVSGMVRSSGLPIEQLVVHVGYDYGLVRAYGSVQQGFLSFEDQYGAVIFKNAQIQNGLFQGELWFTNRFVGEQRLGQFSVPAQGFFFN